MAFPRVSINIVAWNSMEFMPALLASIFSQTFQDFSVLVIDNASSDGLEEYIRSTWPQVTLLRNVRNLGSAPAHNQGIRYALDHWPEQDHESRYVLVTNPDIIMHSTFLEEVVRVADAEPSAGSVGGKLLRAYSENIYDESLKETVKSDLLDSTGLRAHKNRMFTNRGAGEMDEGQYDEVREVFGVSGALVLYRASALEDVRFEDEFFDYDFFAHKEDVDLAWRLQQIGYRALYVPEAVAHHYRGVHGKEQVSWWGRLRNRFGTTHKQSYFSARNHWWMLWKNERLSSGVLALPRILFAETARLFYLLFFEPKNLLGLWHACLGVPRMWRKRRAIRRRRGASAAEIRAWFE